MNHMKRLFFVLSFTLFAVFSAHGQEQVAYQTAQYPGGKEELTRMLSKELILTKKLFKTSTPTAFPLLLIMSPTVAVTSRTFSSTIALNSFLVRINSLDNIRVNSSFPPGYWAV